LDEKGITPQVPVWDKSEHHDGTFSRSNLVCDSESDRWVEHQLVKQVVDVGSPLLVGKLWTCREDVTALRAWIAKEQAAECDLDQPSQLCACTSALYCSTAALIIFS
jgi:hypothetical protein